MPLDGAAGYRCGAMEFGRAAGGPAVAGRFAWRGAEAFAGGVSGRAKRTTGDGCQAQLAGVNRPRR